MFGITFAIKIIPFIRFGDPAIFFEVIDSRLSYYWIFSYSKGIHYIRASAIWAFPEWAQDPDFYDKLTDGDEKGLNNYIKIYKKRMDLEFPDSSISEVAQIGDDEWLICQQCFDAWQSSNHVDALVKCPTCQKIYNNPRYKNPWPTYKNERS